MNPQSQPRKKRNSSKVNLMISLVFHAVLVVVVLYFAARSGLLGEKIKKITVTMEKEKPPVKTPEPSKPPEPPKIVEVPKVATPPKVEAPRVEAPPVVAPPAAELAAFDFAGGRTVIDSKDPVEIYRNYMEITLQGKWNRPEDMADDNFIVEVAVTVDKQGRMSPPVWQKGSGDAKWDDSVKQVFNVMKSFTKPPPTNFPASVVIRFDVKSQATESVFQ